MALSEYLDSKEAEILSPADLALEVKVTPFGAVVFTSMAKGAVWKKSLEVISLEALAMSENGTAGIVVVVGISFFVDWLID